MNAIPKINALIVEDTKRHLDYIKGRLKAISNAHVYKLEFYEADNVGNAYEEITRNQIDTIILDYELEETTADELIDLLLEYHNYLWKVRILLISSHGAKYNFSHVKNKIKELDCIDLFLEKKPNAGKQDELQQQYDWENFYTQTVTHIQEDFRIPSPLAHINSKLNKKISYNREEYKNYFDSMIIFMQNAVKYLSIILLANAKALDKKVKYSRYKSQYTFGTWRDLLESLNNSLYSEFSQNDSDGFLKPFVPEIQEILSEEMPLSVSDSLRNELKKNVKLHHYLDRDSLTPLEFLDIFIEIRNKWDGHRQYFLEPGRSEDIVKSLEEQFKEFKNRLHFLGRYPLFYVTKEPYTEKIQDKPWYTYDMKVLMGTFGEYPEKNNVKSTHYLEPRKIYLSNSRGNFLDLYPFITFEYFSEAGRSMLFMMDTVSKLTIESKTGSAKQVMIFALCLLIQTGLYQFVSLLLQDYPNINNNQSNRLLFRKAVNHPDYEIPSSLEEQKLKKSHEDFQVLESIFKSRD